MKKGIYREYPAKLIYNNGWWFVDCGLFGKIDLGDDIPDSLQTMAEILSSTSDNNDFTEKDKPSPKVCPDCGRSYEYADMHYYWTTEGRHCRG